MKKTVYGKKKVGKSQFVIVAPHGAGDDLRSATIAYRLAIELNAFLVINNTYIKPTNSKAKDNPEIVEDFNRLQWGRISKRYFWKRKKKAMKIFYNNISEYCDRAKEFSEIDKAVAIYVHCLKKSDDNIVDIGCGAKTFGESNWLVSALHHEKAGVNTGKITTQISKIKKLQKKLSKAEWNDEKFEVTIGKIHPGWSGHGAIQFHKNMGRDDYAFQLEFGTILRKSEESINYTTQYLSKILKEVFK